MLPIGWHKVQEYRYSRPTDTVTLGSWKQVVLKSLRMLRQVTNLNPEFYGNSLTILRRLTNSNPECHGNQNVTTAHYSKIECHDTSLIVTQNFTAIH